MQADEILASKTVPQLEAAIAKGRRMLAFVVAVMPFDYESGDEFEGPFPPSKDFERWCALYQTETERLLKLGIRDCANELNRRATLETDQ